MELIATDKAHFAIKCRPLSLPPSAIMHVTGCVCQAVKERERTQDSTTSRGVGERWLSSSLCAHKQRHLENTIRFGRF